MKGILSSKNNTKFNLPQNSMKGSKLSYSTIISNNNLQNNKFKLNKEEVIQSNKVNMLLSKSMIHSTAIYQVANSKTYHPGRNPHPDPPIEKLNKKNQSIFDDQLPFDREKSTQFGAQSGASSSGPNNNQAGKYPPTTSVNNYGVSSDVYSEKSKSDSSPFGDLNNFDTSNFNLNNLNQDKNKDNNTYKNDHNINNTATNKTLNPHDLNNLNKKKQDKNQDKNDHQMKNENNKQDDHKGLEAEGHTSGINPADGFSTLHRANSNNATNKGMDHVTGESARFGVQTTAFNANNILNDIPSHAKAQNNNNSNIHMQNKYNINDKKQEGEYKINENKKDEHKMDKGEKGEKGEKGDRNQGEERFNENKEQKDASPVQKIKEGVEEMAGAAKEKAQDAMKNPSAAFNDLKSSAQEMMGNVKEKASEMMGNAKEKTDQVMGNAKEKAMEKTDQMMGNAKEKANETMENVKQTAKDKTDQMMGNAKEKAKETANEMEGEIKNKAQQMGENVKNVAPSAAEMEDKLFGTKDKTADGPQNNQNRGDQQNDGEGITLQTIVNKVKETAESVKDTVGKVINSVTSSENQSENQSNSSDNQSNIKNEANQSKNHWINKNNNKNNNNNNMSSQNQNDKKGGEGNQKNFFDEDDNTIVKDRDPRSAAFQKGSDPKQEFSYEGVTAVDDLSSRAREPLSLDKNNFDKQNNNSNNDKNKGSDKKNEEENNHVHKKGHHDLGDKYPFGSDA